MPRIRIGTRQSTLALWQTHWAADRLRQVDPAIEIEIVPIRTAGDRAVDLPLGQIGDKGLFVKDLEIALLEGRVDLAVHSLKDLPSSITPGLRIAAVGPREDPRDVIVSRTGAGLADLPPGSSVGTSSARRTAQILAARPDLRVVPLRGNVDTRIAKIRRGECDAGVLAAAGLIRLDRTSEITEYLDPDVCLPSPGQGAIACEIRADDAALGDLLAAIDDAAAHLASRTERACTARLTGGCQIPVAAFAEVDGAGLRLRALVADPAGRRVLRADRRGPITDPERLGCAVAEDLLAQGAAEVLRRGD